MRVVVLNPSPAIDRVYFLHALSSGEVHRAMRSATSLGGNGINVASALTRSGAETRLVMPSDASYDAQDWFATDRHVKTQLVRIRRSIRTNTVLVDNMGATTNINEVPTALEAAEWAKICERAFKALVEIRGQWLVITGSLPLNVATRLPVHLDALVAQAQSFGARVAVDTTGTALAAILRGKQPIDLIKPNLQELREAAGQQITNLGDVFIAASKLRSLGARTVLCSLGADGLLGVDGGEPVWVQSRPIAVANTTGAGDAAMAGFLSGELDGGLVAGLLKAAAWGSLVASEHSTRLLNPPRTIADADVTPFDRHHVLEESAHT